MSTPSRLRRRACGSPPLLALICCLVAAALPLTASERGAPEGAAIVTLQGTFPLIAQGSLLNPFHQEVTRHQANELLRQAWRGREELVILDLSRGFAPSLAAAEEMADTIARRPEGKRVIALVEHLSDAALVVTAAVDEVIVAEAGLLYISGLSLNIDHYTDLLAKMGITVHGVSSGPQKTAPEPLTRSQPSAEALAEYQALLTEIDAVAIAQSQREGLNDSGLRAARALAPQDATVAVATGIAQRSAEPGAFINNLPQPQRRISGETSGPNLDSLAGIMAWWSQMLRGSDGPSHREMVAVVHLEGMIVDGDQGLHEGVITPGACARLFEELADDERIRAVVVRINSGGGSASASDRIYQSLRRLGETKPVVALIDDVAASGGYYIALAAQSIISHQGSITGSIGVFALIPDLSSTRDLLGVHRTTLNSDPRADLFTTNAMNDERRAGITAIVHSMDQRFQGIVAEERDLSAAAVLALADGRVFSGRQAHERGLVDKLGSLPTAVAEARHLAGIERRLPLATYPRAPGLGEMLGLGPLSALPLELRHLLRELSQLQQQQRPLQIWAWRNLPAMR